MDYNYSGNNWIPTGNPPDCGPVLFQNPTDLSKVTSMLYPGQYRGQINTGDDYKPHGGFRFDNQKIMKLSSRTF